MRLIQSQEKGERMLSLKKLKFDILNECLPFQHKFELLLFLPQALCLPLCNSSNLPASTQMYDPVF